MQSQGQQDEEDSGVNFDTGGWQRRRLNFGEKIRNKLESTGNKSNNRKDKDSIKPYL